MNKKEEKDEPQQAAEEDSRDACKYGVNCYQKNPEHHKKYKHPPRNTKKANNAKEADNSKKRKTPDEQETTSTDESKTKKQNVTADSEELQTSPSKEDNNSEEEEDAQTDENSKVDKESNEENIANEAKSSSDENQCEMEVTEIEEKKEESNSIQNSSPPETKGNEKTNKPEEIQESLPVTKLPEVKAPEKENTEDKSKNADPYSEAKLLISELFLVSMPNDFYKFYDFCNDLKPSDPATAFKIADIKLVGPYDVLCGLITSKTPGGDVLLTHWRYYYDPPEFQTVLKGNDKEGLHFGYWRDRPSSNPVFVATNCSNVSHKIKPVAENIFGAVANYLEEKAKKANPFEKTGYFNLLGKLKLYAKTHNITLETQTAKMKQREKNVVARTIHGAGIVCPYNKKTQLGYRELSVTDNQLLKIVKKINDAVNDEDREKARAELGEVVRLATIAGDECDFGTCLELGHDLLSTGCVYVQNAALAVLNIAYSQLERQAFLKIVDAHMKNRKKGTNIAFSATRDCSKPF
ncbi:histone PARylation factor 1 isoform X1 [Nasonia vitripennis]|uniref:PBZ-type domain-containing protein n=1 Tax=Nasonia vitripennis TaxID=7425 RepID=A0A7M7LJQ6_NASVI|nr:histone PARylation factor 1 isoform X1 [Nasonia vitripennis]